MIAVSLCYVNDSVKLTVTDFNYLYPTGCVQTELGCLKKAKYFSNNIR